MIMIDSAREVDLSMTPYFSQTIIGENEVIVAKNSLDHLGISPDRKEKLEVYFDIGGMLGAFTA